MRIRIAILAMIPLVMLGGEVKKAARTAVPAGAERIDANTWRHAGPQGKTWIYKRTPFGIMKSEEKEAVKPAAEEVARSAGRTPFGEMKAQKKKQKSESAGAK